MTFPTIPTGARIVSSVQQNATATRTIDLTGLTKNAGDLLIAIFVGYNTSTGTNAAFSGWTTGWTEFHDSATNGTLPIGMAYKWSDGTETTLSATQAATITGHCAMLVMAIPNAHGSTPPEAGSRASQPAGATLPDPAAFNPTGWDVEDTLWIAVAGEGQSSATGSWTGLGATAPTNYTDMARSTIADVLNSTQVGVCFRQLAAASEDVGTWGADTSNSLHAAVVIAVRPMAQVTATRATTWNATAQVSPAATRATTWNVYVTAADSPGLELSSFGTFSGVNNGDTIHYVRVGIVHQETSGAQAPTYQLWDGATAQIGTTQTGTTGTTDHTDTHDFTGVTYSQLATLRVRVFGHAQTTLVESVDSVALTVNYTAQSTTQVTATRATTWASLAPVTATRATTWTVNETLTQATATRATTWNALGQATSTRQTTWNVAGTLTQVTATRATTWTVGYAYLNSPNDPVGITDSVTVYLDRVVTVNDPVGITDTGVDQFIDREVTLNDPVGITDSVTVSQTITATRATTWNVAGALSSVTASRATSWTAAAAATGARSTTWHTLAPVAAPATRATTWAALARVTPATRATTWHTLVPVAAPSTRSTTWTTRAQATGTRSTTWNVAGALTQVTSTRSTTWNVASNIQAARATSWNVTAQATATRASSWATSARATASRTTTWNVAGALAQVTASRQTTWTVRARTTAERPTTWNALASAGIGTRATSWTVTVAVAPATRSTVWVARALSTSTRATTWATYARSTGSRSAVWDTLVGTGAASRASTWDVLIVAGAPATRAATWSTHAQTTATRATFWDVRIVEYTVLLYAALGPYARPSSATMRPEATAKGPDERLALT